MKNVLFATTALVLTAGVASAEVSFSGTGQVSLSSTAGADYEANTHLDLNVAISGATDNGVTFSTSVGYDAGRQADYNDDYELDAAETNSTSAPEVAIGYNGVTLTVQQDGVDNLFDDAAAQDLGVAGSASGVDYALTTDLNGGDYSYKIGYTMGDLSATVTGTNDSTVGGTASKIAVSYAVAGATLSASVQNEDGAAEDDATVGVSYSMGAASVSYTAIRPGSNGDFGDEWDAKISYTAGAVSGYITMDEADTTHLVAEYDLGGATAFVSSTNATAGDFTAVGINFAF
jgi:outer membrane protein OmpU